MALILQLTMLVFFNFYVFYQLVDPGDNFVHEHHTQYSYQCIHKDMRAGTSTAEPCLESMQNPHTQTEPALNKELS